MKIHGTAKGGAISKKDFGVAFGGGVPPVVNAVIWDSDTFENVTSTGNDRIKKNTGGNGWNARGYGQNVTAVGSTLTVSNLDATESTITGFNDTNSDSVTIGNAGAKIGIRMENTTQADVIINGSIVANITSLSIDASTVFKIEILSGSVKFYVDDTLKNTQTLTPDSTYYPVFMSYTVMTNEAETTFEEG